MPYLFSRIHGRKMLFHSCVSLLSAIVSAIRLYVSRFFFFPPRRPWAAYFSSNERMYALKQYSLKLYPSPLGFFFLYLWKFSLGLGCVYLPYVCIFFFLFVQSGSVLFLFESNASQFDLWVQFTACVMKPAELQMGWIGESDDTPCILFIRKNTSRKIVLEENEENGVKMWECRVVGMSFLIPDIFVACARVMWLDFLFGFLKLKLQPRRMRISLLARVISDTIESLGIGNSAGTLQFQRANGIS